MVDCTGVLMAGRAALTRIAGLLLLAAQGSGCFSAADVLTCTRCSSSNDCPGTAACKRGYCVSGICWPTG